MCQWVQTSDNEFVNLGPGPIRCVFDADVGGKSRATLTYAFRPCATGEGPDGPYQVVKVGDPAECLRERLKVLSQS